MAPELHRGVSSFSLITGMNCAKGLLGWGWGWGPRQPSSQASFGPCGPAGPQVTEACVQGSRRPALGPCLVGLARWDQSAQEGSEWERAV